MAAPQPGASDGGREAHPMRRRLPVGLRLLLLAAVALAVLGAVGRAAGLLVLTTTCGPTAYILLAHPRSAAARVRSAVLGHTTATACGLLCLAVFGLWSHPSVAELHRDTWPQIGAQSLALGLTLLLLTVLDAHHPPAAATCLLVASGIARPGPALYGMLAGLAVLVTLAPPLARIPGRKERTEQEMRG